MPGNLSIVLSSQNQIKDLNKSKKSSSKTAAVHSCPSLWAALSSLNMTPHTHRAAWVHDEPLLPMEDWSLMQDPLQEPHAQFLDPQGLSSHGLSCATNSVK